MSDSSVVVAFEGGLDMVTPVQNSAPGTLIDCLNYEVGPIKGYRRIDGYERFDGSIGGGITNVYVADLRALNPGFTIAAGHTISHYGVPMATVVDTEGMDVYYVPTAPGNKLSMFVAGYRVRNPNTGTETSLIVQTPTQDTRDTSATYEEYITRLYAAQATMRAAVVSAPNKIAGVYYGRTDAYAVVDMIVLNMFVASDTLEVGQYFLRGTNSYRVAAVDGGLVYARVIRTGLDAVADTRVVTQQVAEDGIGAVISVITGVTVETDETSQLYAQPYRVDGSYAPLAPTTYVRFENASAAFEMPPNTVRISDGANYAGFEVLGYSVLSGGFGTSDASGVLYLAGLDYNSSSTDFDGLFTGSLTVQDDLAVDIADVVEMGEALWPGTSAIRTAETFYQWGTYNFKATRGHEMIFCTTGCSRAGWISELAPGIGVYGSIITNPDDVEEDIPKYLAFHAGQRLALGLADGSLRLSAVAEPLNFSGFEGAVELGNGDNITGLLEASGDSTIIFGPRTVRRLVGLGTSLSLNTVAAESGAMDYTAATVAGLPLYVNHNGLCTLDQTSAYGDFKNSAISGAIDPFFTPRIVVDASSVELGGTVCAFPVRAKNQYRLFLADGSVVSMSITAEGAQPMLSSYNTGEGNLRIPFAYSSSVSDSAHEYILCVWDEAKSQQNGDAVLPAANMIYRLDNGWGFDGKTFEHFIDTAYMFNQDPQFLSIDRAILYGMGYGAATLRLRSSGVEDGFTQTFDTVVQDISMPRNPEILYKQLKRVMGNIDHANWGRALTLRFQNITEAGASTTEPSHILQSVRLFVQTQGIPEN